MTEKEVSQLLKFHLNKDFVSNFFVKEKLDEDILEKYVGYFDPLYQFDIIASNKEPEEWWIEFVENKFGIKRLWLYTSSFQKLSELFIKKHSEEVDWCLISKYQELSEGFIEKNLELVSWYSISIYQKLSEDFIERHSDRLDWSLISIHQNLSEDFIERHVEEVNWGIIEKFQNLSKEFLERHSNEFLNME